ncbi:hypothetical protein Y032_0009g392 [Ancylostoma ceylanicum]|uniref:Uncharacterized protein n=1 Tax=Ancylostoma ceylanicum TaxID=53326 RepID=A0A016VHS2_9BILA|nr:hypothetical protein Y032_0009g392 [Ancylostoma ceylanicum]
MRWTMQDQNLSRSRTVCCQSCTARQYCTQDNFIMNILRNGPYKLVFFFSRISWILPHPFNIKKQVKYKLEMESST